jgi:hypothetical protein
MMPGSGRRPRRQDPDGHRLTFTLDVWRAFGRRIKNNEAV